MIRKILQTIKQYNLIEKNAKIIIGLSGGSDSMCLLHILWKIKNENLLGYNFEILAVHVNHNLRIIDAKEDELFVKNFCDANDIDLIVYNEDIKSLSKKHKMTIEEVARMFRKEKFESLLKSDKDKIALAHNLSDNAETILMHLFRGAGLNGLTSMDFLDNNVIRPLLKTSKEDIYKYLEDNNIPYRTDKTNFEEIYARNKVRLSLLPYLAENFNNNIITSLNNTIDTLKIDNNFIEQETQKAYASLIERNKDYISFRVYDLLLLHESILTRVLIHAYCEVNGSNVDLNSKNINDIKSLFSKESGKQIRINKNIIVSRGYTNLFFINEKKCNLNKFTQYIKLDEITKICDNLFITVSTTEKNFKNFDVIKSKQFNFDKEQNFMLRSKTDGDKIYLQKLGGHKEIKKYFSEQKIDLIFRNNIKLLSTEYNLLMILDKNMISTDNFNIGNFTYFVKILRQTED